MFSVEILEASREFTARELIKITDNSSTDKIEDLIPEGELKTSPIPVGGYAILSIHNDQNKDRPDYENIVVITPSGEMYRTGSDTFKRSFLHIYHLMEKSGEAYEVLGKLEPSNNYKGKYFLKCCIL